MFRVIAFSGAMPRSVRRTGENDATLEPTFWQAGYDGPLVEGFKDPLNRESIQFSVSLLSHRRLKFRLRQVWMRLRLAAARRREDHIKRELLRPGAVPVLLARGKIGLASDEYAKISAASSVVWRRVTSLLDKEGYRCCFCYGDSHEWGFIVAAQSEAMVRQILAGDELPELATRLIEIVAQTVIPAEDFRCTLALDSDERVQANEGWQFRLKGEGPHGQSFAFAWVDRRAMPAE